MGEQSSALPSTMSMTEVEQVSDKIQRMSTSASDAAIAESSKGKGRGGGKGGRGARQDAPPSVQLSKALSYILRHGAAKEHLKVRPDGYISLSAVLARPKVANLKMEHGGRPIEDDVLAIVESNDKKRFEISKVEEQDGTLIRAVQGHSIAEITSLDHVPLTLSNLSILSTKGPVEEVQSTSNEGDPRLPEGVEILHGTTRDAWNKIKASGGLDRMKRNHIHLAKGRPGSDAVISGALYSAACDGQGMRTSSAIIIHVDIINALRDNIPFFLASNGAVLTAGQSDSGILPLKYLDRAEESKTGKIIWAPGGADNSA